MHSVPQMLSDSPRMVPHPRTHGTRIVQASVTEAHGLQILRIDLQTLLLDGIGLTLNDMRRLARWHGRVVNPALASASASVAVAQKIARNRAARRKADQLAKIQPDEVPRLAQEVLVKPCLLGSTAEEGTV